RQGDLFQAGAGDGVEIAYVINDDEAARGDDSRSWTIVLREAPGDVSARPLRVVRAGDSGIELARAGDVTASLSAMKVSLKLPEKAAGAAAGKIPAGAGVPGDPQAIQLGDANRNGVFGASLGGRLIKPGDPEKSYLFKRLYDAEAGPLMPLANCCSWTKV